MEFNYENAIKWFASYFEDVNKNQGRLDTIPNLKKYFSPDFEFFMYTSHSSLKMPLSRDELLILFLHPDLQEAITPQYYIVDVKQMVVVVQFEIKFIDKLSGREWHPLQASAHYHLVYNAKKGLIIRKIQYWTETFSDDFESLFVLWKEYREKALANHAIDFFKSEN